MNYTQILKHIESLPDTEALETIESQAAEVSQNETLDKLYSGALIAMTQRRYGEDSVGIVARQMGLKKKPAYERAGLINFYGGFSACAEYCDKHPSVRYSHLRLAQRIGRKLHRGKRDTTAEEIERMAKRTALLVLRNVLNEGMTTSQFEGWARDKFFGGGNKVGKYTALVVGVDANGAMLRLTSGDIQALHAVQEEALEVSVRVIEIENNKGRDNNQ